MKVPWPGRARARPSRSRYAVGLEHGVRVDGQFADDLAGRGQLISRFEETQLQGLMHLLDQLEVGGDTRCRVELEFDHHSSFH